MQTLVQDLAAEQVHENSETAKENSQPQKEELEDASEHESVLAQVVSFADVRAFDFAICERDVEVILPIGVLVIFAENLFVCSWPCGPTASPVEIDRWFAKNGKDFVFSHS